MFSFKDTDNSQDSRERQGNIFYSTVPLPPAHKHSDIYLQICMWDDYHIYILNCTACTNQTAAQWDLPPYWITIWLIDAVKLVFVCLLDDLILGFCYSNLDTQNQLQKARINYHPCITSKQTSQVCLSHKAILQPIYVKIPKKILKLYWPLRPSLEGLIAPTKSPIGFINPKKTLSLR